MISVWLVGYFMFLHWIGDFVLQSHWMASNKSRNNEALISHVFVYTIVIFFGILAYEIIFNGFIVFYRSILMLILFFIANFIAHYVTDYYTSRLNTKLLNAELIDPEHVKIPINKFHNFFVSIGFDQWIHCITLLLTYFYFIEYNLYKIMW